MADAFVLKTAVDTTWSVYRATHDDVDAADSRRCLLERHLQTRDGDAEELASFGLAYLARLPDDECLKGLEGLFGRIAAGCSRPDWVLFAVSKLPSGTVVVFRSLLGA